MPLEDPTSVTVTDTEQNIFDPIENAFDRLTCFVNNVDATGSITVKFYGRPQIGSSEWFLISANDMEPATACIYTCVDLYGDFKIAAVRKSTKSAAGVVFKCVWEPTIKTGRTPRMTRIKKQA